MLTRTDLQEFALLKGLSLGNVEKDYLLELTLFCLSRITKDELVFKGGTALYKFHGLDRFSGGLDFSLKKKLDVESVLEQLIKTLKRFSLNSRIKFLDKNPTSITVIIQIEGPLYTGNPQSLSKVEIDINLKSEVLLEASNRKNISIYPVIPTFTIQVMDIQEILAEKIRAVLTRDKTRDIYDIFFLFSKNIPLNFDLIDAKLEYYNMNFDIQSFESCVSKKRNRWQRDLQPLLNVIPDFDLALDHIMEYIKK